MIQPSGQSLSAPALQELYAGWIKRIALLLKARMPWADLDELLQWGAIGMLESMQRFDPSLGVEFQAFAMRRVRGTMINGLRREGKLRRGEAMFDADVVDSTAVNDGFSPEDPLAQLLRSDDHTSLAAALRQLSKLEYQVLALHYYNEMNNREIAAILDISEGYASKIRKRALLTLATHMAAQLNGEPV
ncbi:sigma-70 family RNA polymerase sigma factor [Acidocella sp.]|jgi:RNA polymerase sigma factor (sigma-70 family)|uniref:sigma-70 family RNA polymerase sigma factor n=1 Tax=Acidocella sp. TaxID=50710 RepID=UPI002F406521